MAAASAAILSACETPYTPIPYDREYAGVQTIHVVETSFPDQATTQKLATNGQNMASAMAAGAGLAGVLVGAVAAGIEAGIEAGQRDRIQAALASVGFDGEAVFDAALEAALTDDGYELEVYSADRDRTSEHVKLKPDPAFEDGAGILDVAGVGYGYQLVGGNTQWRPFVSVSVRLSDPHDPENVLMENRVVYNPVATPEVIINISPDGAYAFSDITDIEADPVKAAEGLEVALAATAASVASLLD